MKQSTDIVTQQEVSHSSKTYVYDDSDTVEVVITGDEQEAEAVMAFFNNPDAYCDGGEITPDDWKSCTYCKTGCADEVNQTYFVHVVTRRGVIVSACEYLMSNGVSNVDAGLSHVTMLYLYQRIYNFEVTTEDDNGYGIKFRPYYLPSGVSELSLARIADFASMLVIARRENILDELISQIGDDTSSGAFIGQLLSDAEHAPLLRKLIRK